MKSFVVTRDIGQQWKARPGYRILVMDRGAVRFDFPKDWVAATQARYVQVIDREPPDDRCGLMVSCGKISRRMTELPMHSLLRQVTLTSSRERPITHRGPVIRVFRPPLEAAWIQMRFIDRMRGREACTRVCLARGGRTLATIVFDFWPEHETLFHDAWTTLIDTLAVGDYIEDPATGRRREKRG